MPDERDLDALLHAARREAPGAERRARVRARVFAALALTGLAGAGAVAAASRGALAKGAGSGLWLGAAKLAIALGGFTVLALGGVWLAQSGNGSPRIPRPGPTSSPAANVAAAHDPHTRTPPPEPAVASTSAPPTPSEVPRHASNARVRPRRAQVRAAKRAELALGEEADLLARAIAALGAHDPEGALEALDAHARRFPAGALAAERSAARVRVLCALGRAPEATEARAAFLGRYASSPLAHTLPECAP